MEAAAATVLRVTVESLKTALEAEKQIKNELRQDRDKMEAAMEKVRSEFAEWEARPWWCLIALAR
jgi:hypothetical protein